jgi:hypothetical protein
MTFLQSKLSKYMLQHNSKASKVKSTFIDLKHQQKASKVIQKIARWSMAPCIN